MRKNPPATATDAAGMGLIPRSGRSPGAGNGKPTPVFLVHWVTKSQTQLSKHTRKT